MAQFNPLFLDTGSIRVASGSRIIDLIHFPITGSNIDSSYNTLLPDPYLVATSSANITNAVNTTSSSLFEFRVPNRRENYFYVHNSIVGVTTSATTTGVRIGLQRTAPADGIANIKVSSTLTAHTIACVGSFSATTFALPGSMVAINTIYPCFVKGLYNNSTASVPINNVVLLQPETNNLVTAVTGSVSYNKFVGYKLDTGFIKNGAGLIGNTFGAIYDIKKQNDNKTIIAGDFIDGFNNPVGVSVPFKTVVRLNSNGSIDTSFIGSTDTGSVKTIAIQSDNKILVGGQFTSYSGSLQNNIVRLNSNGSVDTTFNTGGGFNNPIYSIAIQSDNKILVGGGFTSYSGSLQNNIVRLNISGSVDTTFNTGGGFDTDVYSIAIQSDNKILVGGVFTSYSGSSFGSIVRLNTSGTVDTTFNSGTGFQIVSRGSSPGSVYSIKLQSDNKILVGGDFNEYNAIGISPISRLDSTGSIDPTFNSSVPIGLSFGRAFLNDIAIQSDSKIIIGGEFDFVDPSPGGYIARLDPTGSIDTTFIIDPGFNDTVYSTTIDSNNKILVGGKFATSNQYTQYGITRLNTDGNTDIRLSSEFKSTLYLSTGSLKIISGSDTISASFLPPTSSLWLSQSLAANVANTSATAYATVFTLTGLTTGQRYLANLYMIGQSAAAATGFRMRVATGSEYRGTLYTPTSTTAPAIQNSADGVNITSIAAGTWPTVNTKYLVYGDYTFVKGVTDPRVEIISETAGTAVTAFSGSVIFYRALD